MGCGGLSRREDVFQHIQALDCIRMQAHFRERRQHNRVQLLRIGEHVSGQRSLLLCQRT
jgi:hypothetical protein